MGSWALARASPRESGKTSKCRVVRSQDAERTYETESCMRRGMEGETEAQRES